MAILGFSIVMLHLLIGFGFLIYKLSPIKKKLAKEKNNEVNDLMKTEVNEPGR